MNSANTLLDLEPFPSDIGTFSIGPSGSCGFGDGVGALFKGAADGAFWGGADSCGFAGSPGITVGEVCEVLELQGNHPILPSNGRVVDSKMPK
jgi:hypothetical protein